jgi:acetyl esterase/lipase
MVSGGWVSRWAPPRELQGLFAPYLREGYTVFAVRHGSSPRYGIPDAVADVRRSIRFLRNSAQRWRIDPDRIGVLGMSAGGHLALVLATSADAGQPDAPDPVAQQSSRVKAVAALVPPTDLTKCVWEAEESLPAYRQFPALDLPLNVARQYSPRWLADANAAPALIISGTKDELVPPRHGRWIAEAYQSHGVDHKLVLLPADHGLNGKQPKALATVQEWFDRQLSSPEDEPVVNP